MNAAGQTIRASLQLVARHWAALLLTAGVLLVPVTAIKAVAGLAGDLPSDLTGLAAAWKSAGGLAVRVFELFVQMLSFGAVTLFLASQLAERPVDWRSAWRLSLGRVRPLLTASLAAVLPAIGWGLLFAIPTIVAGMMYGDQTGGQPLPVKAVLRLTVLIGFVFISVRLVYVTVVAIVEGTGGFTAYQRNLDLIRHRFWDIAAVIAPIQIVRHLLELAVEGTSKSAPLTEALSSAVTWLLMPVETAAALLLYMSIRAAREPDPGYGSAQLAADLAKPPVSAGA